MSTKELELEFKSLKEVFTDVIVKIDNLVERYENLEKRYEKCLSRKKKASFKCKKCTEEFESLKDLQKHKEENNSCQGKYQCEECDKSFKSESGLEVHMNKEHVAYECNECGKVFDFEAVLERHTEAVHESVRLFCHYFNNKKECPFEEQCIFLHEESEICKYDEACERKLCMFRHGDNDNGEEDDNDDEESENDDEDNVKTLKPSLEKVKKSLEKVAVLLQQVPQNFKCQQCDFEAKNQNGLNMHIKAKHTNKS